MISDKFRGIFFGALSAACYGLNPLFAVPLLRQGIGVASVLFFRFAVAAALIGIFLAARRTSLRVSRKELAELFLTAALMTTSSVSLFYGYTLIPASVASTLLFLYPIFTALIMIVFFREKLSAGTVLAVALAFCGVGILCAADGGGNAGGRIDLGGAAVVAVSALTYAVYLVAVNKTRLRGMNGTKLSFYILLFGSVFLWANAEACGGIDVPATGGAWANVLLLATIPTLVSTVAIVLSLRRVGPTTTAILGAFEPVAAVAAGVLFLGDPFTGALAAGIALIVAAVSVVVLSGKK